MSNKIFELTHDSLAAKIWEKVSVEEKSVMEVQNFIVSSHKDYRDRGTILSEKDILYIAPYELKVHLNDDERAFIKISKRKHRNTKIIIVGLITATIIGLLIFSFKLAEQTKMAELQTKRAEAQTTRAERNEKANIQKAIELRDALNVANMERNRANRALNQSDSSKRMAIDSRIKLLKEKKITDKQRDDIEKVLNVTNLLRTDHTKALKESLVLYKKIDDVGLKRFLEQNIYDAYQGGELYLKKRDFSFKITFLVNAPKIGKFLMVPDTGYLRLWDYNTDSLKILKDFIKGDSVSKGVYSPENNMFVLLEQDNRTLLFINSDGSLLEKKRFSIDVDDFNFIDNGGKLVIINGNNSLEIFKFVMDDRNLPILKTFARLSTDSTSHSQPNKIVIPNKKTSFSFLNINHNNNTVVAYTTSGDSVIKKKYDFGIRIQASSVTLDGAYMGLIDKDDTLRIYDTQSGFAKITSQRLRIEYSDINEFILQSRARATFYHDDFYISYYNIETQDLYVTASAFSSFFKKSDINNLKAGANISIFDGQNKMAVIEFQFKGSNIKIIDTEFKEYFEFEGSKNEKSLLFANQRVSLSENDCHYGSGNDMMRFLKNKQIIEDSTSIETLSIFDGNYPVRTLFNMSILDIAFKDTDDSKTFPKIESYCVTKDAYFIIVKFIRDGNYYYRLYPTLQGIDYLINNQHLYDFN